GTALFTVVVASVLLTVPPLGGGGGRSSASISYIYGMSNLSIFLAKSEVKAHDIEHKRKIQFNIDKYTASVLRGKEQFTELELARKKAKNIKWKAIEHLDQYLEEFEKNFTARG